MAHSTVAKSQPIAGFIILFASTSIFSGFAATLLSLGFGFCPLGFSLLCHLESPCRPFRYGNSSIPAHAFHCFQAASNSALAISSDFHPIGGPHGSWLRGCVQRPKPSQFPGTSARFVNPTDAPFPTEDAVIHVVLVSTGPQSRGSHGEGHRSTRPKSHRSHIATFQVFDLDNTVRVIALDQARGFHRVVLSFAVGCAACRRFESRIARLSLRLILFRVWQGTFVIEDVSQITAIDPATAD